MGIYLRQFQRRKSYRYDLALSCHTADVIHLDDINNFLSECYLYVTGDSAKMPRKAYVSDVFPVTIRFPKALVDEIDIQVAKGRFRTRTELIITAVRDYLDWLEERK